MSSQKFGTRKSIKENWLIEIYLHANKVQNWKKNNQRDEKEEEISDILSFLIGRNYIL